MRRRKSWREKMDAPGLPKLVDVPLQWRKRFGEGKMLIAHPREVEAMIRTVKKGSLMTQSQLRDRLAASHHADTTCPLTTGIFLRIIAEAAEEEARAGKQRIAPYWRVVKDDGSLNPKYPGGVKAQAARLEAEGHALQWRKGKGPRVIGLG